MNTFPVFPGSVWREDWLVIELNRKTLSGTQAEAL